MANPTSYYHGHKWQITELGLVPAPPKLGRSRNVLPVGGQCNDLCKVFPKGLSNSQGTNPYDTHAYCKRCSVYIPKTDLHENKNHAKILCPCCHAFARLTPSTSAKNRTRKNRASRE